MIAINIEDKMILKMNSISILNRRYFFVSIYERLLMIINEKRVAIAAPMIPINGIRIKLRQIFRRATLDWIQKLCVVFLYKILIFWIIINTPEKRAESAIKGIIGLPSMNSVVVNMIKICFERTVRPTTEGIAINKKNFNEYER